MIKLQRLFKHWLLQSAIAFDQFINAFVFGGHADETISARSWRNRNKNHYWAALHKAIDWLFLVFERDHCYNAYLSEIYRRQYPLAYQFIY